MKWPILNREREEQQLVSDLETRVVSRIESLEDQLESAHREIGRLRVSLSSIHSQLDATVALYEHRIDLLYRRVTAELKGARDSGDLVIETEAAVDARMAQILSAGLRTPLDIGKINLACVTSDELTPGTLHAPLTLYGFRLDRKQARELGDIIEIKSSDDGGGGIAVFGPYKRMAPGRYLVTAHLHAQSESAMFKGDVALDVYSPATDATLVENTIKAGAAHPDGKLSVRFDWSPLNSTDVIEFRLHQRSNASIGISAIAIEIAK